MANNCTSAVISSAEKASRVEKLLLELATGTPEPLEELYELISTDIYAFALSKTANRSTAEDITHDTFVRLFENAKLYRPEGKPLAWIITMELNIIRRWFNVSKRVVALEDTAGFDEDEESDFSGRIVNNEFLREILSSLCEDEREIVSLHVVSELKHREIAKILGKPLSTVLSKYNRAIKKLRRIAKGKENG